ncbi:TolC family protein [Deinococcus lacus]|uniref:TolC family protein n=1 Tax=Deinococcus lacus TaxID=392561 RepID=A0ABW1YF88_9DEIO
MNRLFLTALLACCAPALAQAVPTALPTSQAAPPVAAPAPAAPAAALPALLGLLPASPGWRSADLQYRSAELNLAAARARAGLNVNLGGDVNAAWIESDFKLTGEVTAEAAVSVLPWSPALEAVRSAERALNVARAEKRAAQADLTLRLTRSYTQARAAAQNLALAQQQADLSSELLRIGREQSAQGLLAPADLLDRQASAEQADLSLQSARARLALSGQSLGQLLGQPVTLPSDPAAYADLPRLDAVPGALDTLLARAWAGRPEALRAVAAVADAEGRLRAADLDRLPDLTASVRAGQLAGTTNPASTGAALSGSLGLKSGVAAVQARLPLGDGEYLSGVAANLSGKVYLLGGGRSEAQAQAQAALQLAQLNVETVRQSLALELRQALNDLDLRRAALPAARSTLEAARTALSRAEARQQAGLETALTVAQARLRVVQAQQALSQAETDAALAALSLSAASTELDLNLLQSLTGGSL